MFTWYALLLLAAALLLWWLAARQQRRMGMPSGQLLYRDMEGRIDLDRPLYAADLDLVGRPDYLLRTAEGLVPVEVKSGRTPRQPYESHVYQLAAYCALVERAYGERPSHGIIRYADRNFEVDYTPDMESGLLRVLGQMRADLGRAEVNRSHQQAARCRSCGYLSRCEQAL
jgi:CRISPR-associated exonuclease Cas4